MKFSSKVEVLQDNGTIKEVKGISLDYDRNGIKLSLIVHESTDAWETDLAKVSEKSTGLGMCVIKDKIASKVTKEDVFKAVDDFIKVHTIDKINEVIINTKTIEERKNS